MNCRDVDDGLMTSGGDPVPADVAAHLRACAACCEPVSMTPGGDAVSILTAGVTRLFRHSALAKCCSQLTELKK